MRQMRPLRRMRRTTRLFTLSMAGVLLLAFAGVAPGGPRPVVAQGDPAVVLTAQDNNRVVELAVGDILQIELPEDPNSGFNWRFVIQQTAGQADVVIVQVDERTPAAEAGLQTGDIIRAVNDVTVGAADELRSLFSASLGREVTLLIERDGAEREIVMDVAQMRGGGIARPVITDFLPGMPAEQAGFERNDVILAVDGTAISSIDQLQQVIQAREGEELIVTVRRGSETLDIRVTPQPDPSDGVPRIGVSVAAAATSGVGFSTVNQNVSLYYGVQPFQGELPPGEQRIVLEQQIPTQTIPSTSGDMVTSVWQYVAVAPGQTGLSLALTRPSDEGFDVNELFQVLVVVSGDVAAGTGDAAEDDAASGDDAADSDADTADDAADDDATADLPPASGEVLVIPGTKSGQTIGLGVGDVLQLELPANATTGYRWVLDAVDESILVPLGEAEYVPDETDEDVVGSGGVSVWRFQALAAGETRLKLTYVPPGNADAVPDLFELTVVIE